MRAALILIFAAESLGCSCFKPVSEPDSGSPTTGGVSSTGTTSGGTSGGSSTSGGTTGGNSCGFNLVWHGDVCVATNCAVAPQRIQCLLADGGFGACYGEQCQTVDFSSDPNCGDYGWSCPNGTHCGSWCVGDSGQAPSCSSDSCPPGEACIDTWGSGTICVAASCSEDKVGKQCLFDASLPYFLGLGSCCGTSCVPLISSDHCGGCGVVCGAGEFCDSSTELPSCRPSVDCSTAQGELECPLPGGSTGHCCHGSCAANDALNCGACGVGCPVDTKCVSWPSIWHFCIGSGGCGPGACPNGRHCVEIAPGAALGCVKTDCNASTEGDVCGSYYPRYWFLGSGWIRQSVCCSSTCSELDHDPLNCGRCGAVCPAGTLCDEGACVPEVACSLQANDQLCSLTSEKTGICCDGTCVDPLDPNHCSSCTNGCPIGEVCRQRDGFPPYPWCWLVDGGFADCATLGCEFGWGCVPRTGCRPLSCSQGNQGECALPFGDAGYSSGACCNGVCGGAGCTGGVGNYCSGDPANCPSGSLCVAESSSWGECISATCQGRGNGQLCAVPVDGGTQGAPGICCSQACVDPTSDPNNCGGCGLPCDACTPGGCLPKGSTGDCQMSCGFGTVCVAGGSCVDSTCRWLDLSPIAGVTRSYGFCVAQDGNIGLCRFSDLACADLRNDPLNCGHFDVRCDAGQTCVHGSCQ
jgi:hypothetical protein